MRRQGISSRFDGNKWSGLVQSVALASQAMMIGLVSLACQHMAGGTSGGLVDIDSSPRETADRADDTDLPQIHLLYAIPSDSTDRKLDKNGWIRSSVASAQSWLERESGGSRLRFDTYRGDLDVTFVRLPRRNREYRAFGDFISNQIEYDLWSAGFSAENTEVVA